MATVPALLVNKYPSVPTSDYFTLVSPTSSSSLTTLFPTTTRTTTTTLAAQLVRAADKCDAGDEGAAVKYSRDANLKAEWKSYLRLMAEAEQNEQ